MGEVLNALKAVKSAKAAIGSNGADTSDPGAELMSDPLGSIYPNMPDFSGQGQSQAQGGMPQPEVPQMEAPQMAQAAPVAPPVDNPYDGQNYSNPQDIAASIGKGGDDDIEIKGDAWKPKNESGLGRIMDTLLELRGRRPVFKDRTDDANLRTAMQDAQDDEHPGHINQQKVINRVRKFNPDMADKMQNTFDTQSRQNAATDRQIGLFDLKKSEAAREFVGNAMQTPGLDKNPQAYQKMRERMIAYGNKYYQIDLTDDIPEKWDPDVANIIKFGNIKVKDQERLKDADVRLEQGNERVRQGAARVQQGAESLRQGAERVRQGAQRLSDAEKARVAKLVQKLGLPVDPADGFEKMSPDGKKGMKYHNGRWMKFERGSDGNLHPIGYLD